MSKRKEVNSPLLMEKEAAKYLRIGNDKMADLYRYGFIKALKLGARKYPIKELDKFIDKWTYSDKSIEDELDLAKKEANTLANDEEKIVHI
ncbi:MAG: hypothetical protein NC489_31260 [Ruminococcus flavefaciens]|nr:hypothetical protein [Ruminococcus flavefaciens]